MKNLTSLVASLLILACRIAIAQDENSPTQVASAEAFAKKLPAEARIRRVEERQQMPLSAAAAAWQQFTARTGEWIVEWNPRTGNPHRAYGGQYRIAGFLANSIEQVDQSARRFLADHAKILELDVSQLHLRRAENIRNKWYVSYHQVKDGIPVMFSEVELRLSASGNVMMFGSDFHPKIQLNTMPTLPAQQALAAASRGMEVIEMVSPTAQENPLYILPIEHSDRVSYHLTHRFEIVTANPPGRWVTYVDAHSGEILWRFNRVRYSISGKVNGSIHRNNFNDPLTSHPFPDLNVVIGGQTVVTNAAGEFNFSGTGTSFSVTARLQGRFARVTRDDGASASFTATVQDGQSLEILWDTNNSQTSERDAYFHTNIAHAFIKSIDPNFTGVDYSMPVRVNVNNTCNATWDGRGMNFFRAGNGCRNTAEIPSVVYHEYGHGINQTLYVGRGAADGLTNGAMNEGLADINAAFLVDDPAVGRGFFNNGAELRNVKNNNRYPEDVSGEEHRDGLILAGALWDLREALGLQVAREYSHFARYGTPDDPDLLAAYNEYFIEILVQDDDDGNLANLTPNFAAINQAFSAHGIGSSSLLRIFHQERADAPASEQDYLVQALVNTASFIGVNRNAVTLHYSTDENSFQSLPMSFVSGTAFHGRIPRQPPGSVVSYYFRAEDNIGSSINLPFGAPQRKRFSFLAGFQAKFFDDLETDKGWKVGEATDNATTGIWERVRPIGTEVNGTIVQPENDHTPGAGRLCFVTGNAPAESPAGTNDVDGGKTTLFSPVFDLTSYRNPLIRYYRWYSNNAGASPGLDFWEVHISNDSGKTWVEVERTRETDNSWRKVVFFAKNLLPLTRTMQVRFIAQDQGEGSLIEAAVDDFEILDPEIVADVATPPEPSLPAALRLYANYPNPFTIGGGSNGSSATTIHYDLPAATTVSVSVYDLNGRLIRRLQEGLQPAGQYSVTWNGNDILGNLVSSGFYFVVLEAGERRLSQKILTVK
jgi:Zn-dependent metalloprotease